MAVAGEAAEKAAEAPRLALRREAARGAPLRRELGEAARPAAAARSGTAGGLPPPPPPRGVAAALPEGREEARLLLKGCGGASGFSSLGCGTAEEELGCSGCGAGEALRGRLGVAPRKGKAVR